VSPRRLRGCGVGYGVGAGARPAIADPGDETHGEKRRRERNDHGPSQLHLCGNPHIFDANRASIRALMQGVVVREFIRSCTSNIL
jgi:hypothetical protein